jgi:HD-like signal output (HDOD) protein
MDADAPQVLAAIDALKIAIDSPAFKPPMLPVVAQEALAVATDRNVDLTSLGKIIERDQVLAARFLTVANSPTYRRRVSATTVSAALMRLGLVNSRDLLFFTAVEPTMFASREYENEMTALRGHSLGTATACSFIARARAFSDEYASLAGLIHDLGAAAVVHHIAENEDRFAVLRLAEGGVAAAVAATHELANQRVARRWSLPEPVTRAMNEHHQVSPQSPFIVVLAAAADELATMSGLGSGMDPPSGRTALTRIFVDAAAVQRIIDEFAADIATVDDPAPSR